MLRKNHNNDESMAEGITQPDPSQRRLAAENFLADVEQRAFRMAVIATRHRDEAMDIVQDTMLAWVRHYLGHPREAWTPLFYKVLQSRIRDWQRRTLVRRRVMAWFGSGDSEEHMEQLAAIADPVDGDPAGVLASRQTLEKLLHAVERLPMRQQQAFLLRSWEGLDVAETALAMSCSVGSVKTHLSRATASLRAALGDDL
jgi:RNA polymerase sigma-70 factor (ECF subfamily)